MKRLNVLVGAGVLALCLFAASRIGSEMPALVDVGSGTVLRIHVEGKTGPAVILEIPSTARWRREVSEFARVVDYDRSGWGDSPGGSTVRDATQVARDLHEALRQRHVAPPFIVVSEGVSSLFARRFAELYESEVTGLVMADPLVEENEPQERARWLEQNQPESYRGLLAAMSGNVTIAPQLTNWLCYQRAYERRKAAALLALAPSAERDDWRAHFEARIGQLESEKETYSYIESVHGGEREELAAIEESFQQLRGAKTLPGVRAVLITGLRPASTNAAAVAWRQGLVAEHARILKKFPDGKQLTSSKAAEDLSSTDPEMLLPILRDLCGRKKNAGPGP